MKEELKSRVTKGIFWSLSEKAGSALLQMVVSIIVARLLSPNDYGVMAILTFFSSIGFVITDGGFSQTLIRKEHVSSVEYRSVLLFNVVAALVMYAIFVGISPFLASYYAAPQITSIAPILFAIIPLSTISSIPNTILIKQFKFKLLSNITLASTAVSGIVAIAMALSGMGVWSLVGQSVATTLTKVVLITAFGGFSSLKGASFKALQPIVSYSSRLLATDIIGAIYSRIAQLFIGKMYSTNMLGYYNQAQKLKDLPINSTTQAVQSVIFPAFSKISSDNAKFTTGFREVVALISFGIFPAMAGLSAVAPELFELFLGTKWIAAAPYFRILALTGLFAPLSMVAFNILKVRSDGKALLNLEIAKKIITTLILLFTIPQSVMAIAWGMLAISVVEFILNFAVAIRFVGIKWWSVLQPIVPHFLMSVVMWNAVFFFGRYAQIESLAAKLGAMIGVGIASYAILAPILARETTRLIGRTIKKAYFSHNEK